MKAFQILCWIVCGVCMVLTIGLVGGVDNGEPFTNMLWCIPLMGTALVAGFFGRG